MPETKVPRQRTSFVGRQRDLETIATCLNKPDCQLLTLTGPGGVGKTRLALEVAGRLHSTFVDGVYFVALASLASADDILTTVISALLFQPYEDHDPNEQLLDYLSTKRLLLVMDNCEHLLEDLTLVSEIIIKAPQVKILATSREPLRFQEERLWRVEGLAVPENDAVQIEDYSAIQLFMDRARRVRQDFSLSDEREHVIRICQLVQGLPLALEMAAAWLQSLPCQAIADQIEGNLDFLTTSFRNVSDRHRSIRAVFDHSWQLLSEHERGVFTRLSVFRGGFTIEAAEHVAGATLTNLTALADKSLIQPGIGQRYDLHELLRQYGDEYLADDRNTLHKTHASYFAHFLSQREDDLKGRRQKAALDEIAADYENVRAAWLWAVQANRYDLMNEMLEGANLFFYIRDRQKVFGQLRRIALTHSQLQMNPSDPKLWALLLECVHNITPIDGHGLEQALRDQIRQALVTVEGSGQQMLFASGLKYFGHLYEADSNFEKAIHYYEQSLAQFEQLDDRFYAGWVLQRLGVCYTAIGQWDRSFERSQRSLAVSQGIGNRLHAARALSNLGRYALYHERELARAQRYFEEAVSEQSELENSMGVALAVVEMGYIAFLQNDVGAATRLAAEVLAVANRIGRAEILSSALALQALLAALNGDRIEAQQLAMRSLDRLRIRYPISIFWIQMAHCMADYGTSTSSEKLPDEMLQAASQVQSPLLYACCLPFLGLVVNDGQHPERAVELLGLAATRLSAASGWIDCWQPLRRLRQKLVDELGVEAFETIWDRGSQLNLDMTIATLSHHVGDIHKSQPGLIEPLSVRELEILKLVAEDLSNLEIAKRLYITVATVKSHNNHIYSKLGVKNRTEAVLHARVHGLL